MGAFSTVFIKHLHVSQCKILIVSGSLDFTEGVFQVLHNNFAATLATLDLTFFKSFLAHLIPNSSRLSSHAKSR